MGMRSKRKGKEGEREVAELFREAGFEGRRGAQHRGGPDSPDVITDATVDGTPIHVEVKRGAKLSVYKAMAQAKADAPVSGALPVVFHRADKQEWLVVMQARDWFRLLDALRAAQVAAGRLPDWL